MSLTISTSGNPPDIDGTLVSDAESLAQRIRSAYKFRLGEWFLSPGEGLPYDLVFGHVSLNQTNQVLLDVIREEGGNEVTDIRDIEFRLDDNTRRFFFSCVVDTIYNQSIPINQEF